MIETDLFDFAYVPDWYGQLDELSKLALPEPWRFKKPIYKTKNEDTPILERYIHIVFRKQSIDFNSERDARKAAGYFHVENECACFHTGLYTSRYKGIYACFDRNHKKTSMKDWYFRGFCDELSPFLKYVQPLPQMPSYYMAQNGAGFQPDWPIRVNVEHILGDTENLERIPAKIRKARNLPLLFETAVELGRRKTVVEPGLIVPQGYQGKMQYLLPIYLTNEKKPDLALTLTVIGDALLQKTYTVDFLSKKRVKNNGIVPQYYVENSHEPIIPRDLYMQVQEEMVRRANLRGRKGGKKRVYSSKYALSSIVYCGHCGDIYRRVHWNNRGYKSIVWRCVSRLEEKGSECTAPTINEETLQTAVVKAINELLANKEPFLSTLQKNIATVFNEENDNATDDIDGKLEELQQQLLIQAKSKNDYEDVADEIYRLRELKQNALAENAEREGKRQRIAEMTDFLNEQSCELEEYDEQLVRRLIEKVTVFDDKLTVEFKSGVEIDIEI